jgi:hypothetical protein
VASRPVSKSWLCKQQPLLCSAGSLMCSVASRLKRTGNAGGVFCTSTPRVYDSTDGVLLSNALEDSKMWSRDPLQSDLRMTELTRTSSNCKLETHPLVREEVT